MVLEGYDWGCILFLVCIACDTLYGVAPIRVFYFYNFKHCIIQPCENVLIKLHGTLVDWVGLWWDIAEVELFCKGNNAKRLGKPKE